MVFSRNRQLARNLAWRKAVDLAQGEYLATAIWQCLDGLSQEREFLIAGDGLGDIRII